MARRIWFVHGGGGHPLGKKPSFLRASYGEDAVICVHMPHTTYYDVCLRDQLQALAEAYARVGDESAGVDVAVGSSFGSALLVDLMARGVWRGPTVLLCPAVLPGVDNLKFDASCRGPVTVVLGTDDAIVRREVVDALVEANACTLGGDRMKFMSIERDDHDLDSLIHSDEAGSEDGVATSPSLVGLIDEVLLDRSETERTENINADVLQRVIRELQKMESTAASVTSPVAAAERARGCCVVM